jgi:recombination protein RecT
MSVNNSLAKVKKPSFSAYLTADAVKNKINQIIGSKDGQRFITAVVSAVSINPALADCEHGSILSCALLGETLKLSPSPQLGQYYMVPYNDKDRGKVAQFQLGYKGYIQLAIRSGYYRKINVISIKEGELVKYDPLKEEIDVALIDDEGKRDKAKTIGYFAMFEYHNGFIKALYWSHEKMEAHALKYSQGYAADKKKGTSWTFWSKDFDAMAYKTMLRQLISKWGIMSIDLQRAVESDSGIIGEDGKVNYVDNEQSDIIEMQPSGNIEAPASDSEADKKETPDGSTENNFFDGAGQ